MATNSDNRRDEGLQALGAKTKYRDDYAPEVLETFVNKHQGNDYWVHIIVSDYRSARLCGDTHIVCAGRKDGGEQELEALPFQLP